MMPARKKTIRRLIVEKDFQYRYTFLICLLSGAVFMTFGGIVLYFHQMNYRILIDEALIQIPGLVDSLKREQRVLTMGIITSFVLMVAVLFALGLVVTQRVAGPIVSFKKRLKEFADGKPHVRLSLRKNDEFRNLQDIFNHAMESHDNRMEHIERHIDKALAEIRSKDLTSAEKELLLALKKQNS